MMKRYSIRPNCIKRHLSIDKILDALSLFAVLQYSAYRFLQSTMFVLYYSKVYKLITMGLLLLFGGIRYVRIIFNQLNKYKTKKDKQRLLFRCLGAWCLAIPFVLVGLRHDYKVLIFMPICCMCLYHMEYGKVCRAFSATIGIMLLATILCCLSGTVQNLVDPWQGYVGGYGVINSSDFASYFTFLLLIIWCGIKRHDLLTSILFSAFVGIVSCVVSCYTSSRTFQLCSVLTVFFVILDYLKESVFSRKQQLSFINKTINYASFIAFPLIGAVVFCLCIGYGTKQSWALQLDTIMSGRLETVWKPLQTYGIHALGNSIENMHGNGATIIHAWSTGYTYLDVAYAMLLIRYGWVVTAIITGMWIYMTHKALNNGNNRIAFALLLLAAHAFSEARILDINYNIFLAMPFCLFERKEEAVKLSILCRNKKVYCFQSGACVIVIGAFCILLPRALAWFRTFFYLKGWNEGTAAFRSFVFCSVLLILLLLFKQVFQNTVMYHNKKAVTGFSIVVILFFGLIVGMNHHINQGKESQKERIISEEQIIHRIQNIATQPVYAAEAEELYKRSVGGFSGHVFSVEELGRPPQGTIIVDRSKDSYGFIWTRGKYTQLSDWSGLYTFDPEVIKELTNEGFEFKPYYYGIHNCNLKDTAIFNGINTTGDALYLYTSPIITSNMETDQFAGEYEICLSLSLVSAKEENGIVLFKVMGEAGEIVIQEDCIVMKDFDENGRCEKRITYKLSADTPKVSYAVSVTEGAEIKLEGLTWRRVL